MSKEIENKKIEVSDNKPQRATWSNKWTFVLSAAASAVGLGNIWRFPYLAAKYGGGTFLIVHVIFIFTIGISLLLLELAIGRNSGMSVIMAFRKASKKYVIVGVLAALAPFLIVPYYCVIGGWVCKYVYSYICVDTSVIANGATYFNDFLYFSNSSFIWLSVFIAITFVVIALGVKGGIEKANLIMMPTLLIVAVLLVVYICLQPGSLDGIIYYFKPDLAALDAELVIAALGQAFFTLSLAMGIMITYGSYVQKKEKLTTSSAQISGTTFLVSILAGMIIVPAAFMSFGGPPTSAGPSLMFVTLPQVFETMGVASRAVGILFFVLVLFAALTSSISIVEACVSIISDTFNIKRKYCIIGVLIFTIIGAFFVNSGYNILYGVKIMDREILDFVDYFVNTFLIPIVAILTCIVFGWLVGPKVLVKEIKSSSKFKLAKVWVFMIKFICPIMIFAIFVANLIGV